MTNCDASGVLAYDSEGVSDIIEALVNIEGRKYPIPGMDFEDTAQEIRLECVRVLSFFDSSRIGPSPYKFLQTCVRNFLYNQRRGIWVPNNPPCARCPLWDRVNKRCKIDEIDCDKIVQYRESMAVKAALKKPASLEIEIEDAQHEEEIDASFLNESIRNSLPSHLKSHYDNLLEGKKVSSRIKKSIRDIAIQVINNAEELS